MSTKSIKAAKRIVVSCRVYAKTKGVFERVSDLYGLSTGQALSLALEYVSQEQLREFEHYVKEKVQTRQYFDGL